MKKLSVLIALALVLTIGGAYAAWSFATGTVDSATVGDISVGMEVEETGGKGTLTATFDGYSYTVEPDEDNKPTLNNGNTAAELVITFDPADNAEQDVKDNAIGITVTMSITTEFDKESVNDAITLKATHSKTIDAGDWGDPDGNGVFTVTITSDEIMGWLFVDNTNALTSVDAAEAFEAAVKAGRLTITVAAQ